MQKSGQMVLKAVNWANWVHNIKIRSIGLERSQLGIQCKNQVIWSWKESIGYTMIKLGQLVFIVYPICPIDCFQDHLTWFLHSIPNWLLSRPYHLIFVLCTQLTPFKTIWPNFIIVYPIDSFQDHMTWFLHCIPNWLLSRPIDLIFINVYPIDSFQDQLT